MALRPAREVAERAMVITMFAACVLTEGELSKEELQDWLWDTGFVHSISVHEQVFLDATRPAKQSLINLGWRSEGGWALGWTLGWVNDMGPYADDNHEDWFYENIYKGDPKRLADEATLRSESEITAALEDAMQVRQG